MSFVHHTILVVDSELDQAHFTRCRWCAAAIGVAGLVLLLALPPDTHTDAPSVALAPWMGPSGAGLAIGGRL